MLLFDLFTITRSLDNPGESCSSQSEGNYGYINYYEDSTYKKKLESYYHNGNKYDWNWAIGSVCPLTTGSHTIHVEAYPALQSSFDGEDYVDKGDWCSGTQSHDFTKTLYAHRCYPLMIADYTNCIFGVNLHGYIDGNLITNTTATILDCLKSDCMKGYYTDTCEKQVDAFCNGNGSPEYGRDSSGIGCVCTSHGSNLFCEDTSQYAFPAGSRGVKFTSYYNSSRNDNSATYDDFTTKEFYESYTTIELNSVLWQPQNSDMQFQLTSVPNAELYIDGTLVGGSLSDQYGCEELEQTVITTTKQYLKRGRHTIKIVMKPGCAMFPQSIRLQWMFYRWYSNNPTGFEDIPARYLGTA